MANNNGVSSLLARADKRTITKYIQFSKRVIASITIAATAMCLAAMGLCFFKQDMGDIVGIVKAYLNFATVGFVSYSVNSIGEKFIKSKMIDDEEEDEQEQG